MLAAARSSTRTPDTQPTKRLSIDAHVILPQFGFKDRCAVLVSDAIAQLERAASLMRGAALILLLVLQIRKPTG
jgi:hypothetical protein